MADLQRITHGEPNWDVKVNAIIDNVNKLGNFSFTTETSDGMVFQDGFSNNGSWYRYVQFPGWKLVDLQVNVSLPSNPDSKDTSMRIALQLPDAVSYDGYHEWSTNSKYQLTLNGNQFRITPQDTGWWTGEGSHYVAHILYVHVG